MTWRSILSSLVNSTGLYVHTRLPIFINILLGDLTLQPDRIGEIDKAAVLGLISLYPAVITHPVSQMMDYPALSLRSYVIRKG